MMSRVGICLGLFSLLSLVMLSSISISLAQVSQPVNDVTKGRLLYDDNFSTSKNSIFRSYYSNTDSGEYFENGKVRFTEKNLNLWTKCYGGNISDNIILEVEATQVSGINDNAYGVIFRNNKLLDYYLFVISGDGYYYFDKVMNKTYSNIKTYHHNWYPITWKKSSAIHTGNATNLIRVSCNGDKFSFYVNDIKVDEFTDDSLPKGNIGLIAGTYHSLGTTTIDFDNLKVWAIPTQ